jgi:preprotein translocase subunit SecD
MKNLLILVSLFFLMFSCSDEEPASEDIKPTESISSQEINDDNIDEVLDEFSEESYDILYFKINIFDILSKKIEEDKRDSEVMKLLDIAKQAEENGENAYNVFIREYQNNKSNMQKLNYYFRWDSAISEEVIIRETYNSVFQETQDIGKIIKDRLSKLGMKNARMELLKAGVIKVYVPKGVPKASIENIILKPGRFEFALVKNDNSIPKMIFEINKELTPKSMKSTNNSKNIFGTIFSNLFVTYYLPKDRSKQPTVVDYSNKDFPDGFYYFSFYDVMQEDLKKYLNMQQVQKLIPKNLLVLNTPHPKEYYSDQSKKTFRIFDLYFIDKNTMIRGNIIKNAFFSYNADEKPAVFIELNKESAKKLAEITANNIGKNFALILDSKVYDAPIIRESIKDGKVMLSNIRTAKEAKYIENLLKSGSYDFPVYKYEPKKES